MKKSKNTELKIIQTKNAPFPVGPYSQAIAFKNIVFTSGQIAIEPKTNKLVTGDIFIQTKQVIENLKVILESSGTNLEHVVKTTVYLTNIDDFPKMNEVYGKYFINKPARSTVVVSGLPKGALIEIECVAVIP